MNHLPRISKLLRTLHDHQFMLVSVDDEVTEWPLEGTPRTQRQEAKRIICANEHSHLYMTHPGYPMHLWIYIKLPVPTVWSNWMVLHLALEQHEKKLKQ
jgi:hypothetical protein